MRLPSCKPAPTMLKKGLTRGDDTRAAVGGGRTCHGPRANKGRPRFGSFRRIRSLQREPPRATAGAVFRSRARCFVSNMRKRRARMG